MKEHVVMVDEVGTPKGTRDKREVHGKTTPLHLAFSVFVFDLDGRLLLQQRSSRKTTWPLVWSNSCCGHPQDGEPTEVAATRRLSEELGMVNCPVHLVLPDYRYKAVYNDVMENEICPVFVGWSSEVPTPNRDEVEAVRWVDWKYFSDSITGEGDHEFASFCPWCLEETQLLCKSEEFLRLWQEMTIQP